MKLCHRALVVAMVLSLMVPATSCRADLAPLGSEDLTASGSPRPEGEHDGSATRSVEGSPVPGTIRSLEERADAPPGSRAWTVIYVSEIQPGRTMLVSGEVYVPMAPPPGARDMVLWNHETTGLADSCAPSLRAPIGRVPALQEILDRGHVVVMSDYPGQGMPGPPFYMVGQVNARASVDVLKAVASIPGLDLSGRFVQYGWSQGGQTALHVEAIAEDYAPELDGLGSALIAPASEVSELVLRDMRQPAFPDFVISALSGAKALESDLEYSDILSPEGMDRLEFVNTGCADTWGDDLPDSPYASTTLEASHPWASAIRHIDDFESAGSMPVVIYQGSEDVTTPTDLATSQAALLCEAGSAVEFRLFPGLGHESVVPQAAQGIPAWIEDRFDGELPTDDCP
jgi:pimeloyl-ACP methyl ester carboxylesterase